MSEASRVASVAVTLPPTKIHSGFSMLKGRNAALLLAVEPLLLEEREQAGHQIQLQVVLLRSLVEVEDLVVLAEAVAVEVAVRVVEQRALGVQVGEALALPLTACPKVAEYSKEKPFSQSALRKRIHAPSSPPLAPRCPSSTSTRLLPSKASMAMVFSPISSRELGDFEDLDRLPGEQPAPVLVE